MFVLVVLLLKELLSNKKVFLNKTRNPFMTDTLPTRVSVFIYQYHSALQANTDTLAKILLT
jgi:hypothetical protein